MNALTLALLVAMAIASCNASLVRLTRAEKQALLDKHNRLRSQTANGRTPGQPAAANMAELVWDDRLMNSANKWVQRCVVGHDKGSDRALPGFSWVGQNWAGGHSRDFTSFVQMWFDEFKAFRYNGNSCRGVCGHYTQVVWAKTTRVGCGVARCGRYPYHIVCNYATGGNFNNELPYVKGPAASRCGPGFRRKRSGLCVA